MIECGNYECKNFNPQINNNCIIANSPERCKYFKKLKPQWVNIYLTPDNEVHTGNHKFKSCSDAARNSDLNDSDKWIATVQLR